MRKQFIPGGMKILKNEQGTILVITTALIILLCILFAGIVEFGRYLVVREQAQTATDAAALAASTSGIHRFVEIDVVTDRGLYEPQCSPEDEECPPCQKCGTRTISGIVGDEKSLLDEGEWENFCLPYCDCSDGDCWFKVKKRWVQYEIASSSWGTDSNKIKEVEEDVTAAVKEALAYKNYPYVDEAGAMLSGLSLEGISALLSNRSAFVSRYNSVNCQYDCRRCGIDYGWGSSCRRCDRCRSRASTAFIYLSAKKDWVDRTISTIARMKSVNRRSGISNIERTADDAANAFYKANLPKHAEGSWINRITVYGHEQKNSPYYPSVVVYATSRIKSFFPGIFGVGHYENMVCAQGNTYYRDPKDQTGEYRGSVSGFGKWQRPAADACWKDW
jgi:hypothetical protein